MPRYLTNTTPVMQYFKIAAVAGIAILSLAWITLSSGGKTKQTQTFQKPDTELPRQFSAVRRDSDTLLLLPTRNLKAPALLVKKEADDTCSIPLRITDVKVSITVVGNIASTSMEMTFYNNINRQLEGEFCFPLGEGQTVSAFALDVNGKMREGVVVEKNEGRQVFESVVRRRIDPGLLEWTAGNNFKTRVFPIPSKGYKRIRISFEQELLASGKGYLYFLPMSFKDKVDQFSVHAEIVRQTVKPQPYGSGITTLEFDQMNDSWVADKKMGPYAADKPLAFEIPLTKSTRQVYLEKTGNDAETNYFYAAAEPERFIRDKKLPSKIDLIWDVSGSGENRDIKKEKEILEGYFEKIRNAEIRLITFSNEVQLEKDFVLNAGNWSSLKTAIDSLEYDGGTQLGALDLSKYSCQEFILMSDGLSNFGEDAIKISKVPVMVVSSSQSADYATLKYIAQASNGQFINALTCTAPEAVRLLCTQPYRFISATFDSTQISSVYPSVPTDFRKCFSVSGILQGTEAAITLNFGIGNEILSSEKIRIQKSGLTETGLVRKMWAQKKISELDGRFEKNKAEITALGKQFSVVTRNTSLLVLDRLEDYIQYKIPPPEADMRKLYEASLAETNRRKQNTDKEHTEQVVKAFNERIAWWKTDFKPDSLLVKKPKNHPYNSGGIRTVSDSTSVDMATYMSSTPGVQSSNNSSALREVVITENESNVSNSQSYSVSNANGAAVRFANPEAQADADEKSGETVSGEGYNSGSAGRADKKDSRQSKIDLKTWNPKTPYMEALKGTEKKGLHKMYMQLRKKYRDTPSFFVDASDYFARQGEVTESVRILSNLAELKAEDHQALRVLAHRLQQMGYKELAIGTFRRVMKIRSEEPQSYRDLGLALADDKRYQEAVNMLCKVVNRSWDSRFPEIESFVAAEINNIIVKSKGKAQPDSLDPRLLKDMPVDVRVVINWDSNDCDMDLWTTDPIGELCMYNHARTLAGGRISRDFTGGYGPEEFIVRKALNGKYKVHVNYYGTHQQTLYGPTTIQAELYTNYGKPNEVKKEVTLRLKDSKEVIDLADLEFTK